MLLVPWGCASPQPPGLPAATPSPRARTADVAAKDQTPSVTSSADASTSGVAETKPAEPAKLDPDGNDDPTAEGTGTPPTAGRFERVGRPPLSLRQICDLTTFGQSLYAAHALSALGADGASITRFDKHHTKRPFAVAFDWNRPGQPTKGGGAGQGFLRVRLIDGRLYVPDADPPYNGFGLSDWGTEGYVFVSSPEGKFAQSYRPDYRPPGRPTRDGKPGTMLLPRSYHDFDVIRFRGMLIASTGAVPPKEKAWYGPSPGALHVANAELSKFEYAVSYPEPYRGGVYRLTYLVRFKDKLFCGIQDYDGRAEHDFVVVDPPTNATELSQEYLHPLRVTESGAAQTLRWFTHAGTLYWIAWGRDGVRLRQSRDGQHFTAIALPSDAGAPSDLVVFRGELYVLCEWGLYRLDAGTPRLVARVTEKKSPFVLRDALCSAPLAVYDNELYAGGQNDGSLYRLIEDPVTP